jgi:hypothetical protein
MGRRTSRWVKFGWAGCACVLAVVSCGTVDPADFRGHAGSASTVGGAGEASGGSPEAGSSAAGSYTAGRNAGGVPSGGAPSDGGGPVAGETSGGQPDRDVEPLLPWQVGNSWTYRITKNGSVSEKTTVVGDEEMIGGDGPNAELLANHVTTDKGAADHTESWQAPSATDPFRIVRYREQAFSASTGKLSSETYYEPEKLHVDGTPQHTVAGATWLEEYTETQLDVGLPPTTHDVSERWTVIAEDETLKVPAGTFDDVIHLRKVGNSSKDYWYRRGVGKLKETGTQTEELTDYTLVP